MSTESATLKQLKEERARRTVGDAKGAQLLAILSPEQRAFAQDTSQFVIARAGRRAGKSIALAVKFINTAISIPNSPLLYMGPTQVQAMGIFWKPLVKMLNDFNIPHEAKTSAKRIEFPNGSEIKILGTDSPNAMRGIRGFMFKAAAADEMAFSNGDLNEFLDAVVPALSDLRGQLILASSPGPMPTGIFYQADIGKDAHQWSHHSWMMRQNPYFQQSSPYIDPRTGVLFTTMAEEQLYLMCQRKFNGDFQHPSYRREFYGDWVFDNQSLVYPFDHKCMVDRAPELKDGQYAIGIDLGVVNATAFVVIYYSPRTRDVYFVHAEKYSNMLVDDIAAKTQILMDRFKPTFILADEGGLGKVAAQEMRRRYGLPILAAKKTEKTVHQSTMASDMISGYVHATPSAKCLVDEWALINKDPVTGDELKGQQNHCADAAVYVYRRIYNVILQADIKPETEEERMMNSAFTPKEDDYVY
jgi:phage terminase large subunit